MDPLLMMAASSGDCDTLKSLLDWGDAPVRPAVVTPQVIVEVLEPETFTTSVNNGRLPMQQPASFDAVLEGTNLPNNESDESSAIQQDSADVVLEDVVDQVGHFTNRNSGTQQTESAVAVDQGADQPASRPLQTAEMLLEGLTPQGNTALHVAAKSGLLDENILDSVYVIYNKAKHLLDKPNMRGDTPLHYSAHSGNHRMVSYLLDLAKHEQDGSERVKAMLIKQNMRGETALHNAIHAGNEDIVMLLLTADSELARIPCEGTSPLYLAIILGEINIVKILRQKDNLLSYSGPDGQNALHAAIRTGKGITQSLLEWNKDLTLWGDQHGNTPLHLAVSWGYKNATILLLEANPSSAFQPDKTGSFPIHVAASNGELDVITSIIKMCPKCINLRDAQGRTFLHVAAEERYKIVAFACRTGLVESILNMQDINGNTALHAAILNGDLKSFCFLLRNRKIDLYIQNYSGCTPLDLGFSMVPSGYSYQWNPGRLIYLALLYAGSQYACYRADHFDELDRSKPFDDNKELDKMKDSTQTLSISLVLVATVTFGATFALPGGYRADDHTNGGTPVLAKRYAFDAYIMAITLAFICSVMATLGLLYAGMGMVELQIRKKYFDKTLFLTVSSVTSLGTAFAMGLYLVLSPVSHQTAVAICVLTSLVSLCGFMECAQIFPVWRALHVRVGNSIHLIFAKYISYYILLAFWPLIIIFGWAAISTKY